MKKDPECSKKDEEKMCNSYREDTIKFMNDISSSEDLKRIYTVAKVIWSHKAQITKGREMNE